MIHVIQRDEGIFQNPEGDYEKNLYFMGTENQKKYTYCHFQIVQDIACVHLIVTRWSLRVLKEMKKDFEGLKDILRRIGIEKIIIVKTDADAKFEKFISELGFPEMKKINLLGIDYQMSNMEV